MATTARQASAQAAATAPTPLSPRTSSSGAPQNGGQQENASPPSRRRPRPSLSPTPDRAGQSTVGGSRRFSPTAPPTHAASSSSTQRCPPPSSSSSSSSPWGTTRPAAAGRSNTPTATSCQSIRSPSSNASVQREKSVSSSQTPLNSSIRPRRPPAAAKAAAPCLAASNSQELKPPALGATTCRPPPSPPLSPSPQRSTSLGKNASDGRRLPQHSAPNTGGTTSTVKLPSTVGRIGAGAHSRNSSQPLMVATAVGSAGRQPLRAAPRSPAVSNSTAGTVKRSEAMPSYCSTATHSHVSFADDMSYDLGSVRSRVASEDRNLCFGRSRQNFATRRRQKTQPAEGLAMAAATIREEIAKKRGAALESACDEPDESIRFGGRVHAPPRERPIGSPSGGIAPGARLSNLTKASTHTISGHTAAKRGLRRADTVGVVEYRPSNSTDDGNEKFVPEAGTSMGAAVTRRRRKSRSEAPSGTEDAEKCPTTPATSRGRRSGNERTKSACAFKRVAGNDDDTGAQRGSSRKARTGVFLRRTKTMTSAQQKESDVGSDGADGGAHGDDRTQSLAAHRMGKRVVGAGCAAKTAAVEEFEEGSGFPSTKGGGGDVGTGRTMADQFTALDLMLLGSGERRKPTSSTSPPGRAVGTATIGGANDFVEVVAPSRLGNITLKLTVAETLAAMERGGLESDERALVSSLKSATEVRPLPAVSSGDEGSVHSCARPGFATATIATAKGIRGVKCRGRTDNVGDAQVERQRPRDAESRTRRRRPDDGMAACDAEVGGSQSGEDLSGARGRRRTATSRERVGRPKQPMALINSNGVTLGTTKPRGKGRKERMKPVAVDEEAKTEMFLRARPPKPKRKAVPAADGDKKYGMRQSVDERCFDVAMMRRAGKRSGTIGVCSTSRQHGASTETLIGSAWSSSSSSMTIPTDMMHHNSAAQRRMSFVNSRRTSIFRYMMNDMGMGSAAVPSFGHSSAFDDSDSSPLFVGGHRGSRAEVFLEATLGRPLGSIANIQQSDEEEENEESSDVFGGDDDDEEEEPDGCDASPQLHEVPNVIVAAPDDTREPNEGHEGSSSDIALPEEVSQGACSPVLETQ